MNIIIKSTMRNSKGMLIVSTIEDLNAENTLHALFLNATTEKLTIEYSDGRTLVLEKML